MNLPASGSPETDMSMEDILASIKKIVVQDSEIADSAAYASSRVPSSPTTAARWDSSGPAGETEPSRGVLRLTQLVRDDGTTIDVSHLNPDEWNILQREMSRGVPLSDNRAQQGARENARESSREPRLRANGAASDGVSPARQETGRGGPPRPDTGMTDPRWLARRAEARTDARSADGSAAQRQAPSRATAQAASASSAHTARESARGFEGGAGSGAGHRPGASRGVSSSLDVLLYDILNQKIDEWMQSEFGDEVRETLHAWMEARLPALVEALVAEKVAEQLAPAPRRR